VAKKYNWQVALEQTLAKTKAPKSETPGESVKEPTRQFKKPTFKAVKGTTMGKLNYDPSNPIHQELVSRTDLHNKIFITEEGPMVDTAIYRKMSAMMEKRRQRSK
jgi:hypothetical protein